MGFITSSPHVIGYMPVRELHEKNDIQMSGASSGPSGPRGRTLLGLAHSKETHGKNGALQARARSESTNVRNELRGGLPDRVREGRDVRGRKGRGAADNDREAEHNPPEHRLNVSPLEPHLGGPKVVHFWGSRHSTPFQDFENFEPAAVYPAVACCRARHSQRWRRASPLSCAPQ